MQELKHRLLTDLRRIGIDIAFELELKPYSKTYFGRYDPNVNKITLYVYEDKACKKMTDYKDLLLTLVHEAIHCLQWSSKSFVRRKGVMHDTEFFFLYNRYSERAKSILLMQEVKKSVRLYPKCRLKVLKVID